MANPIFDLQALARVPLEAGRGLAVIAQALQTFPDSSAAVQPLPDAINDIRHLPGIQDAAAGRDCRAPRRTSTKKPILTNDGRGRVSITTT